MASAWRRRSSAVAELNPRPGRVHAPWVVAPHGHPALLVNGPALGHVARGGRGPPADPASPRLAVEPTLAPQPLRQLERDRDVVCPAHEDGGPVPVVRVAKQVGAGLLRLDGLGAVRADHHLPPAWARGGRGGCSRSIRRHQLSTNNRLRVLPTCGFPGVLFPASRRPGVVTGRAVLALLSGSRREEVTEFADRGRVPVGQSAARDGTVERGIGDRYGMRRVGYAGSAARAASTSAGSARCM